MTQKPKDGDYVSYIEKMHQQSGPQSQADDTAYIDEKGLNHDTKAQLDEAKARQSDKDHELKLLEARKKVHEQSIMVIKKTVLALSPFAAIAILYIVLRHLDKVDGDYYVFAWIALICIGWVVTITIIRLSRIDPALLEEVIYEGRELGDVVELSMQERKAAREKNNKQ